MLEKRFGRSVRDELAQELVQETFLAVWKNRKQYQHPRPFRSWIYTIAANVSRSHFRRPRPVTTLIEDGMVPSSEPSAESSVMSQEREKEIASAVTRLPVRQRTAVVLRLWSGMSYAEIAETLECGEATARSHMCHGLARLREVLRERD